MAGAAKTADDDEATVSVPLPAAPKKAGRGIGLLIVAVLLSAGASAGVSWFVSSRAVAALNPAVEEEEAEAEPDVPEDPANYFALEPAFVVNLDDQNSQRFLQVQVEVMSRSTKTIEHVQRHVPRIRSSLLLLFGQQRAEELSTRSGKEKLQADVLAEIQNILRAETGEADVEAVYFTSFVMQ